MFLGLVCVRDLLVSVDGVSVKGLDIPAVVGRVVGAPGTRATLELYRSPEVAEIPPAPVITSPTRRFEVSVRREVLPSQARDSKISGLGIILHKVCMSKK